VQLQLRQLHQQALSIVTYYGLQARGLLRESSHPIGAMAEALLAALQITTRLLTGLAAANASGILFLNI